MMYDTMITAMVPMMTRGKLRQACLIELSRIAELNRIAQHGQCHHIGASVTLTVRHEGISLERAGRATRLADPGLLRFEATVTRVGDRWVVTSLAAPAT